MPRLPRLSRDAPEAPQAPEAQADQPTEVTSGDPLAAERPAPTSTEPVVEAPAPVAEVPAPVIETPAPVADAPPSEPPPTETLVLPADGAASAGEVVTPGEDSATVVEEAPVDAAPGFRSRARIRRRLRYLRRYRELAFRDLGGLMFDLHRFGRERPDLLAQKLDGLTTVDGELRALEGALRERRDVTELREPGIASCPRCQTLHNTDANFCPGCGTALRGAVVRDAAPVAVAPAAVEQPPAAETAASTPDPAATPKQPDAPA